MNDKTNPKNITLIGLGIMGRAVARAYSNKGYKVHAWNRGKVNQERTKEMKLENVTVHENLDQAIRQSDNLVLMMVLADELLATAQSIIQSVDDQSVWKGKTLVQFTSHEPFAIQAHEELMTQELHANLIGGAMMAVPTTVGTDQGIFLVSSKDSTLLAQPNLDHLSPLGTVVPLVGDIGLAALADIGLLQGLQFGLAGNELSCLIFERYGVDQAFKDTYRDLLSKTTVPILCDLIQEASRAIFDHNFDRQAKTYTAAGHRAVYEAHQYFLERMGLEGPTYLSTYLEQFRKVDNAKAVGPSAIVKTYTFANSQVES